MATKQSSTLKAKTTRRAAKPAKKRKRPAAACPVEKLGRENERLDMERWGIEQLAAKMTGAQKENAERLLTIIHDKMRANRIAATYLKPRSNLGAAFLLASAYADCKNMTTERNEGHTESFRRAERAMYALGDWFFYNLDTSVGSVAMRFYMPHDRDPNRGLQGIMEKTAAKAGAS